jgi:acetyltransferase-like isoleucine patch superfamily enzyme
MKLVLLDLKNQLAMIRILIHNTIYNFIPLFRFKNIYLRLTGTKIGKSSYIHTWTRFTYPGRLIVGDNCTINFGCHLDVRGFLSIGNNVMLGHNCKVYTCGHNIDDDNFTGFDRAVTIEDNVVIFPNALIMPGVKIAKNAVVLNGSVVTKDVQPDSVVGGNPAKFVRKRNANPQYKLDYKYWFINS